MSLQNYLPANLYLHSDSNAPKSAKVADNFSTLLKACLVTGYGDKPAAGWTLLFEDTSKNTKVFRSPALTERSFDVRVVDNGASATVQVCFDMASIDDVSNLKLQCNTPFRYNPVAPTGRWALIATSRGFWFFNELQHANGSGNPIDRSGTYIFCGDTCSDSTGRKALYLKHTGGTWGDSDDDRGYIFSNNSQDSTNGMLYDNVKNNVVSVNPQAYFTGAANLTDVAATSQVCVIANRNIWRLPAFTPSAVTKVNYHKSTIGNINLINHGTSTTGLVQNFYVPTNLWDL